MESNDYVRPCKHVCDGCEARATGEQGGVCGHAIHETRVADLEAHVRALLGLLDGGDYYNDRVCEAARGAVGKVSGGSADGD